MRKGAFLDIFFMATMDKAEGLYKVIADLAAKEGVDTADIGTYIQPTHQGVTSSVTFTICYDPKDRGEAEKAARLFEKASTALCNAGAYFSRPYGSWARLQMNRNAVGLDMARKVKNIFDPDHIMNPGKVMDF